MGLQQAVRGDRRLGGGEGLACLERHEEGLSQSGGTEKSHSSCCPVPLGRGRWALGDTGLAPSPGQDMTWRGSEGQQQLPKDQMRGVGDGEFKHLQGAEVAHLPPERMAGPGARLRARLRARCAESGKGPGPVFAG